MIWRSAQTFEPVAPGSGEDGGPPSVEHRWCPNCKTERHLVYDGKAGCYCEECQFLILILR